MRYVKTVTVILTVLLFGVILILPVTEMRKVEIISDGEVKAEVMAAAAENERERRQGLSNVESLADNRGMLFIFPAEEMREFWMRNTSVPLDIIFISSERRVINIKQADPEPGVPPEELTRYRSEEPAQYVLEVNQGFSERNNIRQGDEVRWRRLNIVDLINTDEVEN